MKTSNKIVLFRPPPLPRKSFNPNVPLSLLAIAAPLEKMGYIVKIVDGCVDEDYKEKVLKLVNGAICLGITSITGYQIKGGLEVSKAVKEKYPHIPIVWGGWHPTLLPKQTVACPYVDIVVKGQGERTFAELVECLRKKYH